MLIQKITVKCKVCGKDGEREVLVPETCSRECRIKAFNDGKSKMFAARRAAKAEREGTFLVGETSGEITFPQEEPQTITTNQETNGTATTDNPGEIGEGGGSEGTDNIGQDIPGEDRVDTTPEPIEGAGGEQG